VETNGEETTSAEGATLSVCGGNGGFLGKKKREGGASALKNLGTREQVTSGEKQFQFPEAVTG